MLNDVPVSVEDTVALKVLSAATALNVTLGSSTETEGPELGGMKFVGGTKPILNAPVAPTTTPEIGMKVSPLS